MAVMRVRTRPTFLVFGIAVVLVATLLGACTPGGTGSPSQGGENSVDLTSAPIEPKRVEGAPFPPATFDFEIPLNEEDKRFDVPDGPERGSKEPANVESTLKEIQRADIDNGGSQEPLNFRIYD